MHWHFFFQDPFIPLTFFHSNWHRIHFFSVCFCWQYVTLLNSHVPDSSHFLNLGPSVWDTKWTCYWSVLCLESPGCNERDCGMAVTRKALEDRMTMTPIAREKHFSLSQYSGSKVDPFQEEIFLGPVPTLMVTSPWHSRKSASPEPRSLTGKCCQRFLFGQADPQIFGSEATTASPAHASVHRLEQAYICTVAFALLGKTMALVQVKSSLC